MTLKLKTSREVKNNAELSKIKQNRKTNNYHLTKYSSEISTNLQ